MGDVVQIEQEVGSGLRFRWKRVRAGYHRLSVHRADGWRLAAVIVRGEDDFWWYWVFPAHNGGRSMARLADLKPRAEGLVARGPK
jgi:hypothetical protein